MNPKTLTQLDNVSIFL